MDRGTVVARRDDRADAIFFLEAGGIDLVRYTGSGDEIVIHRALPGETLCEAALFSSFYHCDVVATEITQLNSINKAAVLEQMRSDPDFALAVSERFAGQIQDGRRRLEILAIREARARVFAAIAEGFLRSDIKSLASLIGLSHEATYRALSSLAKSGRLIKTGRGQYRLPGQAADSGK
ncbi:MAG: Crp/Fnr family transcriptional regulator [Hoeflea sp.]|uniref:Crp/Fnr family transcriptional regulator n=1 Tax=Hoeflea sp. TaxID=1940281 RepID=UPI0032ED4730